MASGAYALTLSANVQLLKSILLLLTQLKRFGIELAAVFKKTMELKPLEDEATLSQITAATNYQVILKHNTTCPISKGVVERMESESESISGVDNVYILDLLENRELSNAIAGKLGVPHQSPQVLLVKDGRCIYHEWGFDISAEAIAAAVKKA